jgi:hypothetical protein
MFFMNVMQNFFDSPISNPCIGNGCVFSKACHVSNQNILKIHKKLYWKMHTVPLGLISCWIINWAWPISWLIILISIWFKINNTDMSIGVVKVQLICWRLFHLYWEVEKRTLRCHTRARHCCRWVGPWARRGEAGRRRACRVVSGRDGLYIFLFDDALSRKCFNPWDPISDEALQLLAPASLLLPSLRLPVKSYIMPRLELVRW